jgi:hypothetical protein
MPLPARVHVRRSVGGVGNRGLVFFVLLGHGLRGEPGTRQGSGPGGSALEKCAARFIVLAHADFLLRNWSLGFA